MADPRVEPTAQADDLRHPLRSVFVKSEAPAPEFLPRSAAIMEATELRHMLDRALLDALPVLCLGLSVVYAFVSLGHALVLPPDVRRVMLPLALASLVLFAGLWIALRRVALAPRLAHPVFALLALTLALNSLMHLALTDDAKQTTNLSLVIVGAACVITSMRWMALLIGVLLTGWIVVFAGMANAGDWVHFGFMNFLSVMLSIIVLRIRLRLLESNARSLRTLELQAQQMEQLSLTDPLTGLGNRRAFEATLRKEWERARRSGRPVAVLAIDIDHFKRYNDGYGHLAGDQCLVRVSTAMRTALRAIDTLGRFGGEEFVALLPESEAARALEAAERVRAAVEALALPHAATPGAAMSAVVTVSIGAAAALPADRADPGELLAAADEALYRAKAGGRNRCVGVEAAVESGHPAGD
jgi:diguanylate cyclase (GGDEF)-like protein